MGLCVVHYMSSATEIEYRSRSIAEAFQDMLRQAFEAGSAAAANGETFENWYQREILQ